MELNAMEMTTRTGDERHIILNGGKSEAEKEPIRVPQEETDTRQTIIAKLTLWTKREKRNVKLFRNILCAVLYYAYYGYAMYCHFGDEGSIRLTVCTIFGTCLILWHVSNGMAARRRVRSFIKTAQSCYKFGRRPVFIRWALYIIFGGAITVYIIVNVALKEPTRLVSLAGLGCFLLFMVLLSNNKRKIQWHTVFWGTVFQFLLGLFVLKVPIGQKILMWLSDRLQELLSYSSAGSEFIFGNNYMKHKFAFKILPSIIFFTTTVTLLQYFGVIQAIVRTLGRFLAFCLGVSAPEAMNVSANIFVGGGESAVIVLQYLDSAPVSHLFTFLTAGAASLGGAALIQFISFGVPGNYLLAASVMSAPAAIVCSKIMYPDEEDSYHVDDVELDVKAEAPRNQEARGRKFQLWPGRFVFVFLFLWCLLWLGRPRVPKGVVEALVLGAKQGIKLITNIAAVLIVFLALVDFADATVMWFGERVDIHGLTLKLILSYIFYPFSFLMGVDSQDCLFIGEALGIRTVAVAPVAFLSLGEVIKNSKQFESYLSVYNNTGWSYKGDDIFLQHWNVTLRGGVISERSALIGTYALCGFASITTVGLSLGSLGALAPRRLSDISKVAPWAVVSGTLASYLTACVAGVLS